MSPDSNPSLTCATHAWLAAELKNERNIWGDQTTAPETPVPTVDVAHASLALKALNTRNFQGHITKYAFLCFQTTPTDAPALFPCLAHVSFAMDASNTSNLSDNSMKALDDADGRPRTAHLPRARLAGLGCPEHVEFLEQLHENNFMKLPNEPTNAPVLLPCPAHVSLALDAFNMSNFLDNIIRGSSSITDEDTQTRTRKPQASLGQCALPPHASVTRARASPPRVRRETSLRASTLRFDLAASTFPRHASTSRFGSDFLPPPITLHPRRRALFGGASLVHLPPVSGAAQPPARLVSPPLAVRSAFDVLTSRPACLVLRLDVLNTTPPPMFGPARTKHAAAGPPSPTGAATEPRDQCALLPPHASVTRAGADLALSSSRSPSRVLRVFVMQQQRYCFSCNEHSPRASTSRIHLALRTRLLVPHHIAYAHGHPHPDPMPRELSATKDDSLPSTCNALLAQDLTNHATLVFRPANTSGVVEALPTQSLQRSSSL
ncbi:hypothetical protein C8R46DRAFT_1303375 [Mycena filopes]|nr:hypothetical protein C8R46DRAFT_1303375 [Mycena filopes]